ncbi:TetR-like C-terminal domain-containing protein [Streptomyces sp. NPDC058284]|uniref:TetR-like C-terminal domain-containing protein n=1 Tax=unclassified Streptomyces TaxID=2593676 RepID=UPI00365531BD
MPRDLPRTRDLSAAPPRDGPVRPPDPPRSGEFPPERVGGPIGRPPTARTPARSPTRGRSRRAGRGIAAQGRPTEAQHDPDTAKSFHKRYLGPRRALERDMLARAVDAGEIAPALGPEATADAVVGPIVYRALTGSSIPRGLVDTLVEDLLRPRTK